MEQMECGNENIENTKPKFSADQLLKKAEETAEKFEFELALKFCKKALSIEPNNIKAIELSGSLHLQLQNPEKAYEDYTKAIELCPNEGHSKYMCLGQLSYGEEAVEYYKKGIEIIKKELSQQCSEDENKVTATDLSNAYIEIAENYHTDGCFEESAGELCKQYLDLAMAADPDNAEVYHLYASHCISIEDKEAAKQYLYKGLETWLPKLKEVEKSQSSEFITYSCPISYSGRVRCSKLLIELEDYETASDILEYLLDEDDRVVEVWYLLGWLNYLRGPEFKGNAQGYMSSGIEVAKKVAFQDKEMLAHMEEIATELSKDEEDEDEEDAYEDEDEEDKNGSSDEEMK